jgi:DNA-directed RNA polymerase subunit alpha
MNCLLRSNITTVGELIGKGTKELLKLRNFGQKSYQEIEDRLTTVGLSLNPKTEELEAPATTEATAAAEEEETPKAKAKSKKKTAAAVKADGDAEDTEVKE